MKLVHSMFEKFMNNEPLVNAQKKVVDNSTKFVHGDASTKTVQVNQKVSTSDVETLQVEGAWVVNTREEAKRYYPKLVKKQEQLLNEFVYGASEITKRNHKIKIVSLYLLTFGTAFYGTYNLLTH